MKQTKKIAFVASGLVGLLGLYGSPLSSPAKEFDVPKYNLKGAEKLEFYLVSTPFGDQTVLKEEDLKQFEGYLYSKVVDYFVDRNKDGKADLVYEELLVPAAFTETQKDVKTIVLFVDDPRDGKYDGYVDRILVDHSDAQGNFGADGTFDEERHWFKIEDLKPQQ